MATRKKLGTPRGVKEWRNLDTAGDCKRLFKWLIHSLRDGSLDAKEASVMALIGSYLVKTIEVADLETKLDDVKQRLDVSPVENRSTAH